MFQIELKDEGKVIKVRDTDLVRALNKFLDQVNLKYGDGRNEKDRHT